MTTAVIITCPKPNHHDLEVVMQQVAADGSTHPAGATVRLTDGESTVKHVYSGARVVITEVPKVPK